MKRAAPCLLCARHVPRRFAMNGHDIFRCDTCDFEFVHPVPSAAVLSAVYARDYFRGAGHGYVDYFGSEHAVAVQKAEDRVSRVASLGAPRGGRWLDLGCADGTLVAHACECGFDAYGVEVSEEALQAVPAKVRPRVFAAIEEARGPMDVVTLYDVLEHLPDPMATLRQVRALTAHGGLVAVVVPVIDNVNARVWGRSWDPSTSRLSTCGSFHARRCARRSSASSMDAW